MAAQNQMDQFETYFRKADLDQDGRISGAEAVAFFQGSNLPKQVLAQIWTYADQNRAGFLGRQEFYNALKLVTVAQSKRELTPDIVKAALFSPASAKIPPPKINSVATLGPQSSLGSGTPTSQVSGSAPTAPQVVGIRGPPGLPSQQSHFTRPPQPSSSSPVFQSQQGVGSQAISGGSTSAVATGTNLGVTSQFPSRGVAPGSLDGLGAAGFVPSPQPRGPRAQGTLLSQADSSKTSNTSLGSQAPSVTGNGFTSDSAFGDVFSVTTQPKQDVTYPTSAPSALPISSAIVPTSAGTQPTVRPSSLPISSRGTFPMSSAIVTASAVTQLTARPSAHDPFQRPVAQQPGNFQNQQGQLTGKTSQQVSVQASTAFSVGAGNSATSQSQLPWPKMTQTDVQKYGKVFVEVDTDKDGKITGEQARNLFLSWRLPREVLKQVWDLSDQDNDSMLSFREFCIAVYLMERYREGRPLPPILPNNVILDEAVLPAAGQPALAYGGSFWRPPSGLPQSQGVKGTRSVGAVPGGKPPRPIPTLKPDEGTQPSQQRPKVPVLEKHLVDQLSTEEQNSLNSKFQEATDAEKKVSELEKEIKDAREKIQFYHVKMQELILYKSRCDNRINEITERASGDKREVESLAKKYEEKYKQAGDVASKLTIEEATFRDIQEKKMELYRAIVKMDQNGNADSIQDSANHIHMDLEELVKALNERCKTYGLRAKPTSLVELPFGWQTGIQEGAADWDDNWDKFEDEGFTFVKELTLDVQNIIAPPKPKSSLVREKISPFEDKGIVKSSSDEDGKEEKTSSPGRSIAADEGSQSEEQTTKSPPDSPARSIAFESPRKEFQEYQSRKDISFDGSPHATHSEYGANESAFDGDKGFDEPGWGAFDTNYDTDAAWDFNPLSTKDADLPQKHNETSLFGSDDWGLSPIKTGSSFTDNTYPKQSPFFDSVPSTPAYSYVSSPSADGMYQRKSPFAFADSVPSTPMYNNSPRRFSEVSEDRSFDNFSRFDSFNMHDTGPFASRESFSRFDSMRSSRDFDYDQGFSSRESLARFDSFRSTADSDYNFGLFPPRESLTRFDSIRSTRDSDYGHGFPSFDDADPFRSSDPFKTSVESQTPRRDSDSWKAF